MGDLPNAAPGAPSSGNNETAANRMGIIEINDLVYKMESDLSVAINRTHKNNYCQQTLYDQTQTTIAILNSGADYVDPRRSFLTLTVLLPVTDPLTTDPTNPVFNMYQNAYFGPSGSILNFLDSVVISSRSGDELSRVNDYGQLMHTYLPWTYGIDWAQTVGQEIGLGSFLGGSNTNGVASKNHCNTFQIPLYLLSPFFTYGRLLPSMIMSGLKIELRWKPLGVAAQLFWHNGFQYRPIGSFSQNTNPLQFNGAAQMSYTNDRAYLAGGTDVTKYQTLFGLDSTIIDTTRFDLSDNKDGTYYFQIAAGHNDWKTSFNQETGPAGNSGWYPARAAWLPGIDQVGFSFLTSGTLSGDRVELLFDVVGIHSATQLIVYPAGTSNMGDTTPAGQPNFSTATGQIVAPFVFRQTKIPFQQRMQRQFAAPVQRWKAVTPSTPLSGYQVSNPYFQLCSIQLTDSVQRHLNEYSSVNGLEIVFADWDRTAQTLSGSSVAVYTEVRKSASRALQAFSVVVPVTSSTSYLQNSFAAVDGGYWLNYQYQLGSLYFPQQQAESKGTSDIVRIQDNMFTLTYALACDAWDRWHPKAAPTIMSLRGNQIPYLRPDIWQMVVSQELRDDTYLIRPSEYGQYGSFANGGQCVAVTLERSSMFDLSGIPVNNSRVLALRGNYVLPSNVPTATQFIYLKYVRIARIFLINVEVEQ